MLGFLEPFTANCMQICCAAQRTAETLENLIKPIHFCSMPMHASLDPAGTIQGFPKTMKNLAKTNVFCKSSLTANPVWPADGSVHGLSQRNPYRAHVQNHWKNKGKTMIPRGSAVLPAGGPVTGWKRSGSIHGFRKMMQKAL